MGIQVTNVTKHICQDTSTCFHATSIDAKDLTTRSLHAGGATALIFGHSDFNTDTIKLLSPWRSDTMMCSLHQEAQPALQQLACKISTGVVTPF